MSEKIVCPHCGIAFQNDPPKEVWQEGDVMVFLPHPEGSERRSFRCDCGSNVFRPNKDHTKYRCNGCGAVYVGER